MLAIAALALAAVAPVSAVVHDLYWNITYAQANPDQMFERRVIGVNGTWPPPPIEVTRGDVVRLHATNGLGDVGTALHAHGLLFNGTSYYDGAVGVTQCPIPPGSTFTYEIATDLQEGTTWLHAHYKGQYVDGLRTPFIIHPTNTTKRTDITWDEEITVVLGDWYHEQHTPLLAGFLSKYNPTGAEPVPESSIMYISQNGSYVGDVAKGVNVGDLSTLNFLPGRKYRIRIINMSGLAMFNFRMDGHDMRIIEADGIEVEPYLVDTFPVAVAQRYSIIVEARNETNTNYVLHADMDPQMFDAVPADLKLNMSATISYGSGNARQESSTRTDAELMAFDDLKMVPLEAIRMATADQDIPLSFAFDTFDNGNNRASFNDVTWQMPIVPSLFTALSMGTNATNPRVYGAQTNAHVLKHMDNVQMTIYNTDAGQHPFHLHGHTFQIVHKSMDVTSDDPAINPPMVENQVNPFRRDTFMVPPGGSVSIRFRADNPGAWLFHCHIDWHLSSGLAAVMIVDPVWSASNLTIPKFMKDQCAAQNIPTAGNVVGLFSTSDFTGEPLGPWPIVAGWTPKAKGAMAGCVLSALLGMASVVWYSWGSLNDDEIEAEELRRHEAKVAKKAAGQHSGLRGLVGKIGGGGSA